MTPQWWAAYWRLRCQQEIIDREFIKPLAKLTFEKILEVYPELRVTQQQTPK